MNAGEEEPLGFDSLNEPLIVGGGIDWWSIAALVMHRLAVVLRDGRVRG